jgi:hypothetical protein
MFPNRPKGGKENSPGNHPQSEIALKGHPNGKMDVPHLWE